MIWVSEQKLHHLNRQPTYLSCPVNILLRSVEFSVQYWTHWVVLNCSLSLLVIKVLFSSREDDNIVVQARGCCVGVEERWFNSKHVGFIAVLIRASEILEIYLIRLCKLNGQNRAVHSAVPDAVNQIGAFCFASFKGNLKICSNSTNAKAIEQFYTKTILRYLGRRQKPASDPILGSFLFIFAGFGSFKYHHLCPRCRKCVFSFLF